MSTAVSIRLPSVLAKELDHIADEFMSKHAGEGIIAFDQFEVGTANAGAADADQGFIRSVWLAV